MRSKEWVEEDEVPIPTEGVAVTAIFWGQGKASHHPSIRGGVYYAQLRARYLQNESDSEFVTYPKPSNRSDKIEEST